MHGGKPGQKMSDDGSTHSLRSSSPALSENTHSIPHRYLGLCIPTTQTAMIPPEFDPHGKAVEALQREHHDAMTHWGYSDTGTIFTSVRFQLSKSVHVLQTTLSPYHAQHYEHLLATAIQQWAIKNQRGTTPVGPSFDHSLRRGNWPQWPTIRSISAEPSLSGMRPIHNRKIRRLRQNAVGRTCRKMPPTPGPP